MENIKLEKGYIKHSVHICDLLKSLAEDQNGLEGVPVTSRQKWAYLKSIGITIKELSEGTITPLFFMDVWVKKTRHFYTNQNHVTDEPYKITEEVHHFLSVNMESINNAEYVFHPEYGLNFILDTLAYSKCLNPETGKTQGQEDEEYRNSDEYKRARHKQDVFQRKIHKKMWGLS